MDQQQTKKVCSVCSMPLNTAEDYPQGADLSVVDWCKFCGTKDELNSYEIAVFGMSEFIKKTQGMADEQAKIAATEIVQNSVAYKSGRMKKKA
jgi:hypothetical protein